MLDWKPNFPRTLLLSLLVIVPCFWHPIVSGVDLQSHLYNAWLWDLIRSGQIHGLHIRGQATNLLFDILAAKFLPLIGVSATERCLTSIMVLTMFWGAYCFIDRIAGQTAGWIVPWIAVLCYGYVFQIGFSNYYLSTGICFFALTLAWNGSLRRILASVPLLCLAYVAHPIPVLWAAGILVYARAAKELSARWQGLLCCIALAGLELVNSYIRHHFETGYSRRQLFFMSGTDQIWLVGWVYVVISGVLLALILIAFIEGLRSDGVIDVPAQVYILTAFAIGFMPSTIGHPNQAPAALIAQRLSLLAVVLLLALASRSRLPRSYLASSLLACAIFFVFLYRDIGRESRAEETLHALVATLPPGQRVLYMDRTRGPRTNELLRPTHRLYSTHLISRACIGTCFDYMNYEPSTGQFRITAAPGNAVVAASVQDSGDMQDGSYRIQPSDLPAYAVLRCADDQFRLYAFRAGEMTSDLHCM